MRPPSTRIFPSFLPDLYFAGPIGLHMGPWSSYGSLAFLCPTDLIPKRPISSRLCTSWWSGHLILSPYIGPQGLWTRGGQRFVRRHRSRLSQQRASPLSGAIRTGRVTNFQYRILEYLNRDDADRAIKDLDGKELRGRPVRVALDDSVSVLGSGGALDADLVAGNPAWWTRQLPPR